MSLGVAKVGFRAESVREDGVAVVNAGGALLLINRPDVVLLEVPEQLNLPFLAIFRHASVLGPPETLGDLPFQFCVDQYSRIRSRTSQRFLEFLAARKRELFGNLCNVRLFVLG